MFSYHLIYITKQPAENDKQNLQCKTLLYYRISYHTIKQFKYDKVPSFLYNQPFNSYSKVVTFCFTMLLNLFSP